MTDRGHVIGDTAGPKDQENKLKKFEGEWMSAVIPLQHDEKRIW